MRKASMVPHCWQQENVGSRVDQGIPILVEHASNGFGLMPAKGGKTHLTEQEIAKS